MRAVVAEMPPHRLAERKRSGAHRFDEMWNGVLHIPPVQTSNQQEIQAELCIFLQRRWAKPRGCEAHQGVNLTTPEDEAHWTLNYRIPDLVLLDKVRLPIDKNVYMAGAPLVVVEIKSAGDETYDKFPFYAGLGVPEVWVFDRDTRTPELYALGAGPAYQVIAAAADGWVRSPATGVEFKSADGLRWEPMADEPVITAGAFDSQNLAFWDPVRKVYRAYWRTFTGGVTDGKVWKPTGVRAVRTATSKNFLTWENQADLTYRDSPAEHLYTNQVKPYHRAPPSATAPPSPRASSWRAATACGSSGGTTRSCRRGRSARGRGTTVTSTSPGTWSRRSPRWRVPRTNCRCTPARATGPVTAANSAATPSDSTGSSPPTPRWPAANWSRGRSGSAGPSSR